MLTMVERSRVGLVGPARSPGRERDDAAAAAGGFLLASRLGRLSSARRTYWFCTSSTSTRLGLN